MFIPITIDEYLKEYLKGNPRESEKVLRFRLESALENYKNGVKCPCGKDIILLRSHLFACYV